MIKLGSLYILLISLGLLGTPSLLFAQPGMGGCFPPNPPPESKMRETLQTVMLIEMTKYVGLTKEQALEIAPILDEITENKQQYRKRQQEKFKKLKTLVEVEENEKEIKSLIQILKKEEREFRDKDLELREKLLTGLTPVQQAKMILFQVYFREKIREIMRQAKRMKLRRGDKGSRDFEDNMHPEYPPERGEGFLP